VSVVAPPVASYFRSSRSSPKPSERIESLHSVLRFRVPLGDGARELKLIKRQGYGRAGFDLLRARVLAA
jgi:hypothetical protein